MLAFLVAMAFQDGQPKLEGHGLHGYINCSVKPAPEEFGYGVSLYVAVWPLLAKPVSGFQSGLASTWVLPDNRDFKEPLVAPDTVARKSMPERGPSYWTVFQTIEGGLGVWQSKRFFSPSAKFRMNGTTDGYNHELCSPGWDFYGRPLPSEYMGIAQLSPNVLIPPDGLNLASDACGELFGYAYMALPLVPGHEKPVKTGNQCWTAFLNTANFRGPLAFFVPAAWSKMSEHYPTAVGRGMDAMRGLASSGAIEVNTVPKFVSKEVGDSSYVKIPDLQFPVDKTGRTTLMTGLTAYSKAALWDEVEGWMKGGAAPSGKFDQTGAYLQSLKANPMHMDMGGKTKVTGIENWVTPTNVDEHTFGLQWNTANLKPWKGSLRRGVFPSYYKKVGEDYQAVAEAAVPDSTGLAGASFASPKFKGPYVPSEDGKGVWMNPGPAAGPFQIKLNDGSTVTYYWYRFIDQPAMQHAGLTDEEKEDLQALVVKIHKTWTSQKQYLPDPPTGGKLASVLPSLLVHPPKGMEYGYVPVAYRQDRSE